jgi:LytS/YehU family sensor histidine kinase
LLLQPLVENAIRYGMNERFEARIEVQAQTDGAFLQLTVRDYGMGLDNANSIPPGIGLRNTRERLERLYGTEQSFAIQNAMDGVPGALVSIRLPLRFSAERGLRPAPQSFASEHPSR